MSEANLEIVRRCVERFIKGEAQDPDDLSDEYAFDNSDAVMTPGVYRGADGLEEYRKLIGSAWEEISFEPEEYIPVGDDVIVRIQLIGVGRDGIRTTAHSHLLCWVREGRVTGVKAFQDMAWARAAAGASR